MIRRNNMICYEKNQASCYIKDVRKNLGISAKLDNPDLLKVKVFWNNGYDIIIFVFFVVGETKFFDMTQILLSKILLPIWAKFVDSSISIREAIISSIL